MRLTDSEITELIKKKSETCFNTVRSIRHHLHANPELSFKEYNTSAYVSEMLDQHGFTYTQIAETGLTGVVSSGKGGKAIALRAELDALPIQESNTVFYSSKNEGVMHACGHDVHTACMFGALLILNDLKELWDGQIKYIFQPGEELLPGGASLMINEGVLSNPKPDAIIAQHVQTDIPSGKVGFRAGMYMASCDEIYITIHGKGGHAAMPKELKNPLFAAAHVLAKMELLINTYSNNPDAPIVINFGDIHGKGATNVVPDIVTIAGTFRAMDEKLRTHLQHTIKETIVQASIEKGCTADVHIDIGYPFLLNDEAITNRARQAAIELLGMENVIDLPLRMTSEDFAFYTHYVPACFYRLGTGNKSKGIISPVHTSTFDIDEDALRIGTSMMAWIALKELNQ